MKAKYSLLILLMVFIFSGCQSKFDKYQDEAEDCVRYQLAVANCVTDFEDWFDFMEWVLEVTKMSEETLQGGTYRERLVANADKNPYSAMLLETYDSLDVVLTKAEIEVAGKVWTFSEINTGLDFTFSLIPTQKGDVYYKCEVDSEKFSSYVQANFMKNLFNLIK